MTPASSRKRLVENLLSLLTLQGVTYLLPLITLPYLVRVLGPESFGLLAFAQAFVHFFVVLTDYGFNYTATREISINRDDISKVSEIFCTVLLVKLLLMVASLAFMVGVLLFVPQFREEWAVHLVFFVMVVGNVLFPVWFYQGIEQMKYITAANVSSRVISTAAIFVVVRDSSDVLLAAALQAGGMFLAGVLGISLVRQVAPVEPIMPSVQQMWETLRDGWPVFVSQVSNALKSYSGVFILGLFYGNLTVGYFAIADKILKAVMGLAMPVSNAVYPQVSALAAESRERALNLARKALTLGGSAFLLVSVALFVSADLLVWLVAGEANPLVTTLIRIMAITPFINFVDNVYGVLVLLPLRMNRYFMHAAIASGLFSVAGSLVAAPAFGAKGIAVVFVLSQVLVLSLYVLFVYRLGIRLHGKA